MPSLREILTAELKKLPGIEEKLWPDSPGFTSFQFKVREVAHFDTDHELDVRLTKEIIASERLEHPRDSTNHPKRFRNKLHWIVLPFHKKSLINEVVRLVKVAAEQV